MFVQRSLYGIQRTIEMEAECAAFTWNDFVGTKLSCIYENEDRKFPNYGIIRPRANGAEVKCTGTVHLYTHNCTFLAETQCVHG